MKTIPSLTVQQPHAWALILGPKRVENRSWYCKYRGPLAIHAATTASGGYCKFGCYPGEPPKARLTFGAIIGVVMLDDCLKPEAIDPSQHEFASGPWCFVTRDPAPVEPIPFKGQRGLWPVDLDVIRQALDPTHGRELFAGIEPEPESIAAKAAYVRSQGQDREHHCHWPGCEKQVPPAVWGCKPHWFKLPKNLRDAIWATYRPGQEKTMTPSREYVDAARAVQEWIHTNHPPQTDTQARLFGE